MSAALVSVTVTLGKTAPLVSLTVPAIEPTCTWANAAPDETKTIIASMVAASPRFQLRRLTRAELLCLVG
jgi:hypothetical protein